MLNKKEILAILTTSLVLGIIISLVETWNIFFITFLTILLIILINITTKKITSFYLDTEIEIKLWEFKRFWYKAHQKFPKPIAAGIFIPLIVKFFTIGLLNWMACLTFEASGKVYRAAKRHGIYAFSELSEKEVGWIAGAGIIANIFFAIFGYLMGFTNFATFNIIYAFYNTLPLGNLDGSKIFFGSIPYWTFLMIISSLGVLGTLLAI